MLFKAQIVNSLRTKLNGQIKFKNSGIISYLPQNIQKILPFSPIKHPLAPLMNNSLTGSELFKPEESQLIKELYESNKFYILEKHKPILENFYFEKQNENSPLGNLYKELGFFGFLNRLITKKFKAIYGDGRLIIPRDHDSDFQAIYKQQMDKSSSSREFLEMIGTGKDQWLYKEYLSLEEGAISPFIVPQAYFLPLSDGNRATFSPLLHCLDLQRGSLFDEWNNAHPNPVSISYLAAPEFRNCFSLQYDLLACVRFENLDNNEAAHFAERQDLAIQQSGFASVIPLIYGQENAFSGHNAAQTDTIFFESPAFGKGVFYVNAYKNRLQHNLYQLLELANLALVEPGTVTIKGMGLGAFAIGQLLYPMERIFLEMLEETLAQLYLPNIKKINLINLPSSLKQFPDPSDQEYWLLIGAQIDSRKINSQGVEIEIINSIGSPLAAQSDTHLATHICGDSLSYPGNEVFANIPPKVSSDDSVMHYAGGCDAIIHGIETSKEGNTFLYSQNKLTLFAQKTAVNESKIISEKNDLCEQPGKIGKGCI